jgi:hypothetical protein
VSEIGDGDVDRVCDPAASSFGGTGRTGTGKVDDEAVAADEPDRLDRQSVLPRE